MKWVNPFNVPLARSGQVRVWQSNNNNLRLALVSLLMAGLITSFFSATSSTQAAGRTPIILIPGVAGSTFTTTTGYTLYTDNGHGSVYQHTYGANEGVWVNIWEAALPGSDDYFDTLKLNYDAVYPIVPTSALALSGIYSDGYKDIIDFLHRKGYVDNVTLFTFGYDWRRDINLATLDSLDALVNRAIATSGNSQVDLVGHSMGGLVARNYLNSSTAASQKVRRLISFGTPYLGSPKFLKTLLYGDQFGPTFLGLGLNPDEVKDLVQNMTGGWELLPTGLYYSFYDNSTSGLLSPYREDRDIDGDGKVSGVFKYSFAYPNPDPDPTKNPDINAFLSRLGKNPYAAAYARSFHDRIDRVWTSGPRISFINGSGLATLGQIRDYTGTCWSWFSYKPCPKTDLLNIDGDGTVPYFSATPLDNGRGLNFVGEASIHIVNREHGALVQYDSNGDGPSLTLLGQILDNLVDPIYSSALAANKTFTSNLAAPPLPGRFNDNKIGLSGFAISATNGVEVEAVDSNGKHTGRIGDKDAHKYERGIAGSTIDKVDGTQQVFLPETGRYTLRFTSTSAGSFDLKIRLMQGDKIKQTAVYLNIPVEADNQLEATFEGLKNGTPVLHLSQGQGKGRIVKATALLDEEASLDQEPPAIVLNTPKVQADSTVTLEWQVSDKLAGVELEQGLLDANQLVQKGQRLQLGAGEHTLQVLTVDKAGNAAVKEVKFRVG